MENEYTCMLRVCPDKPYLYLIKGRFDKDSKNCEGFQILRIDRNNDEGLVVASVLMADNDDVYITQRISDRIANGGLSVRHFLQFCEQFYGKYRNTEKAHPYFYKTNSYYDIGFFEYSSPDCPESQREIFSKRSNKKIVENNGMIICFRAWEQYYKICTITIDINGNLNIEIPEELRLAEIH